MADTAAKMTGDMPPDEFRRAAESVIDWIESYLEGPDRYPVMPRTERGDVLRALGGTVPQEGCGFPDILGDFEAKVVPGITHWNHPNFFAYFAVSGAAPGILAEVLAATLNVNAMLWRTSPAATELEEVSVDWVRQMLGLPPQFRGHLQDTASTSVMVALAAAREALDLGIRSEGMAGRDLPRLRIYCTDQTHSSVDKAAIALGLGLAGVRKIETDSDFRMRPEALLAAIREDRETGVMPMAVIATVGTTSSTSIDPADQIADVCEAEQVWLHVDGAYGGSAAAVPELRPLFQGWERADSVVVNPHKWMFVPIGCSILLLRDPEITVRAFAVLPEYLTSPEGEPEINLMDYGIALGRRFRSLKLWATLRYFGSEGIAARIREHIELADTFAGWVERTEGWRVLAPHPFSTVCFRYEPEGASEAAIARLNRDVMTRVNRSGTAFLSHTTLAGQFALRLAIGNIRTTEAHVEGVWTALKEAVRNDQMI